MVDDRCVTNFNDGNLQVPPIKYRDCLFRICPQCRYAARRQFWRSVKPGQSRLVEAFVQKLSEAADVEKEQNEKEKLKQHGQEVRYGQLIQLLHVKSNKYLTGMVIANLLCTWADLNAVGELSNFFCVHRKLTNFSNLYFEV